MYQALIFYHSIFRWLVLVSLIYSIYRAYIGLVTKSVFSKWDDTIRHSTATIAHVQLVIGIVLYTQSPMITYFMRNFYQAKETFSTLFFGIIHALAMVVAIIIITIGSSLTKRKENPIDKFKTQFVWFAIALVIIVIAIPWPFSPLAQRPYFR